MIVSSGWGPKLTGRMAEYANAQKGTLLLGDVQAHMIKEYSRPSTRRQDIIHPSEMAKTDWCPRSTYYRIAACRAASDPFLKPAEYVGVQLMNIFDEGHAIHDKWQKRLRDMGILWGNWYCEICDVTHKSTLYPALCDYCNCSAGLIYREVPLRAEQYLIAGHADGAIPEINALIEIKSVGPGTVRIEAPEVYQANSEGQMIDLRNLWADIKEPFPSHVRQGQLYLRLCNIMGLPFTRIVFIYEAKFNQGVKEFVVDYDPKFCDEMFSWCEAIVTGLEMNVAPICITGSSCKDCEKYGTPKPDPIRVEQPTGGTGPEGTDSSDKTVRRTSRTADRIVRSTR